jgi:predicted enzyme related to lactoylglutathione lyase
MLSLTGRGLQLNTRIEQFAQTLIDTLKRAGLHFRNQMDVGPGGRQIQIEDPDGNPIELFEPQR